MTIIEKEVMMVFTTLDFAERYLLKAEVRTSASMSENAYGHDDAPADGPADAYQRYAYSY